MSLMFTPCMGCSNPSECAPHGCARNRGVGSIVFGPGASSVLPAAPSSVEQALESARKAAPCKGCADKAARMPAAAPPLPRSMPTGWVCPKCDGVNGPHVPTCFHCMMRLGATA